MRDTPTTQQPVLLEGLFGKPVVAVFNQQHGSSDGGAGQVILVTLRRGRRSLAIAALLAGPALAGVEVERREDVDLRSYETYAWKVRTPAARPEIQEAIVRAIDRELEAAGWRKVPEAEADAHVVTQAFSQTDVGVQSTYVNLDRYEVGVSRSDVIALSRGTLIVELIDAATDRSVWRATATEVLMSPSPDKVRKKIDKAAARMFRDFPRP